MSPEKRPKSVRAHTRRLVSEARRDPNPDFESRGLPILRQRIQNFDERFDQFMPAIIDVWEARKEKYEKGTTDKLAALIHDYEDPKGSKYNPNHPEILIEIKDATDVIVGIFTRR